MSMYQFFYLPLQKLAKEPNPFITEDQISLLFGNLTALMDQAKKMNTMLAKVLTTFTPHAKIGFIFTENAEQLKAAFTPYVDPFDEANALFLSLRKDNERFREWLSSIEFKQSDLGLESYLIMPIQRVTRYGLLLRELIHQTWHDHDDYEGLCAALQAVEEVASHVNGHKKKVIMQQKIKAILSSIISLPADSIPETEDRLYITEGPVTDLGDTIPVTHHIFLFSDFMVWTQMINKKKFMFRKMNWLKDSTAEPVEKSNAFRVITQDWSNTVFTKTKEDQNKWLAYLENDNFVPTSDPTPHHKRPEVVFLSKAKMVEDALKRGPRRTKATGSAASGNRGSSRRSALNASSGSGGSSKEGKKKNRDSVSVSPNGGSSASDDKSESKPKKTKIPRGYVTIDPKMLEEVKLAKAAQKEKELGSSSKESTKEVSSKESTKESTKELPKDSATSKESKEGRTSSKDISKRESKDKTSKDPSRGGSPKSSTELGASKEAKDSPKGLKRTTKKKGETITPEMLAALRSTRNMSETEQAAYLAKLQEEGEASLPPNLAKLQASQSSSSAPSAASSNATSSTTKTVSAVSKSSAAASATSPQASSSAPSLHGDSSSSTASTASTATSGGTNGGSSSQPHSPSPQRSSIAITSATRPEGSMSPTPFKRPVAKSVSVTSSSPGGGSPSRHWEGPPPPMPDVSHVNRGISPSSSTSSVASSHEPSKVRAGSLSVHSSASKPASSARGSVEVPASGSDPSASSSSHSKTDSDKSTSSKRPSSSKRDPTEVTGDVAKRRSGSVAVSSKTII